MIKITKKIPTGEKEGENKRKFITRHKVENSCVEKK